MFGLGDLDAVRVLDCAAGGASFVAEARTRGFQAVAVDPVYGGTPTSIHRQVELGLRETFENVSQRPERYLWGTQFVSPSDHLQLRSESAQIFLDDFATGGNYLAGSVFELPVRDAAFEIVLCSHFLFLHAAGLTIEQHLSAVQELMRVSAREVRIFPLTGFQQSAQPACEAVTNLVDSAPDWSYERVKVKYEFLRGASEMLRIFRTR